MTQRAAITATAEARGYTHTVETTTARAAREVTKYTRTHPDHPDIDDVIRVQWSKADNATNATWLRNGEIVAEIRGTVAGKHHIVGSWFTQSDLVPRADLRPLPAQPITFGGHDPAVAEARAELVDAYTHLFDAAQAGTPEWRRAAAKVLVDAALSHNWRSPVDVQRAIAREVDQALNAFETA